MSYMKYFIIASMKLSARRKQNWWRHTARRLKAWKEHRAKKTILEIDQQKILPTTFHYVLPEEEESALSFSLDENIPMKLNENKIQTEFKSLYW